MCGRFGLFLEEGIFHRFNISEEIDLSPSYNIAPGMSSLVVTRNSPNKAEIMRWGLIPPWAKDISIGYKMINARAETLHEKPAYRNCFESRRCLIPFNCFYEWHHEGGEKTPYVFCDTSRPYLSFAGLYEIAKDAGANVIKSFTIITTSANESMASVHERMPVILDQASEEIWLDKETPISQLQSLLTGYTSSTFTHFQISDYVNSALHNDPRIIVPAEA